MMRGVCIWTLALGLGGLLPELSGQEAVWHSAGQRPVTARGVPADSPAASLGRPVPVSRGVSPDAETTPQPFPAVYTGAAKLNAGPVYSGAEPIATFATPGAVIAASLPMPVGPAVPAAPSAPIASAPAAASSPPIKHEVEDQGGSDLFASVRDFASAQPAIPPPPLVGWDRASPIAAPANNWQEKYPVTGPPPVDGPPLEEGAGLRGPRMYFDVDYLLWWLSRDRAPVLATTGSSTEGVMAGRLGQADTVILDNGTIDRQTRSGLRFTAGYALDDCGDKVVELSGFFLPQVSDSFTASSATYPVIARPFFSVDEGIERVQFTAFPGAFTGTLRINSPSDLWGLGALARCNWCCGCDYRVDVLFGFRFLDLREQLEIIEDVQGAPTNPPPFNSHFLVRDAFTTNNLFYGDQLGLTAQKQFGRFTLDGLFKLSMGVTHQELTIQGSQQSSSGTTSLGGLYALDSNIGNFNRDRFAVVPELGITLGWLLTDHVQLTLGYNALYWSDVIRPGQQIDRNLDVNRIPNFQVIPVPASVSGAHPEVLFKDSDLWAQGLSFGLRFTW